MPTQVQRQELKRRLLRKKLGTQPVQSFRDRKEQREKALEQEIAQERLGLVELLYELAPYSLNKFFHDHPVVEDMIDLGSSGASCFGVSATQLHHWDFANWVEFFKAVKELKKSWAGIIHVTVRQEGTLYKSVSSIV